jgi:hypothetical protein
MTKQIRKLTDDVCMIPLLLVLIFVLLAYLLGCALFQNNLVECRKACGSKQMVSYSEIDGTCICK